MVIFVSAVGVCVCAGELIILNETKAILFPVLQDVNLSWLYTARSFCGRTGNDDPP